ncbi:MAG: glycosyltransferase family 4 protein [Bacteroidota bacterium]
MSQKKNILFVSSWYPNRLNATLGIFVKRHAQAVALKHNVSALYVCPDVNAKNKYDVDVQNEEGILTVRVYYKKVTSNIPLISNFQKIIRNRKAYSIAYAEILKCFGKPDLVHSNMLVGASLFSLYLKIKYKIPYLVTEHWTGYLPSDGNYKGFFLKSITKVVANNATFITPVSIELQNALQSHGFKKPKYQIVPNVVDVNLFSPKKSKVENSKIRVVHVSSLDDRQKNISGILTVVERISKWRNDFELIIIGDGEDKLKLEKQVKNSVLLNSIVFFNGKKTGIELVDELNKGSFFILFSNFETTVTCAALEAMAVGLPVLASDLEVSMRHINQDNGLLVEVNNLNDLEKSFNLMLDNFVKYDSVLIRNYVIKNFGAEKISVQFNSIYDEILNV